MTANHDELLAAVRDRGDKRAAFAVRLSKPFTEELTMAEPKEQQTMDAVVDKPTERVRTAARLYVKSLYHWQHLKDDLEIERASLLEKMGEDLVVELEVTVTCYDDKQVKYSVQRALPDPVGPKIKCKILDED